MVKHKRAFIFIWMNRAVMNLYSHSVLSLQITPADVETTEQFILLHTRYVCDFSG